MKNSLSKQESKAYETIKVAFDKKNREWEQVSDRLLNAFKGRYYKTSSKSERFTVNSFYSIVSLIMPNLIFQKPYISVKAKNSRLLTKISKGEIQQRDALRMARNMEAAMNYHYEKIDAIGEDRKCVQDTLFYPFGVAKNGYSFKTITKKDKDYVLEDTAFRKRVNPRDFGFHPLATGVDDSPYLIHRIVTPKVALKAYGFNVDDLPDEVPEYLKDKNKKSGGFTTIYEVHHQEQDKIYTFTGNGELLEKIDNPYYFQGSHFSLIKFSGDNDEFEGIPLLEMVEDEAVALNEIMTLIVEHFRKFPGQVFIEEGSVDENQEEAIRTGSQGSIHIVKDISKILRTNPLAMGQEYFQIVNLMNGMMDRILGIPDFQRLTSASRKSATEATFIQGDATLRRNYLLNIVKNFVLDGVKKQSKLLQQFMDEKEYIQASGELDFEEFELSKKDIQGDYIFDFDIDNLTAAQLAQFNNINNLLNTLAANPVLQPVLRKINPDKAGKQLFKLANLNYENFTSDSVAEVTYVSPDRENELSEKNIRPSVKPGEDHNSHIEVHTKFIRDKIKELGQDRAAQDPAVNMILEHLAETQMMKGSENPAPMRPEVLNEKGEPDLAQPRGPRQ